MNADQKKEILSKLQSKGVFSEQIENDFISSFRELYQGKVDDKIAMQIQHVSDEKLIEAAPKLLQIAEMFHDHMLGNEMERTMVFNIVAKVLQGIK